MIISAVRPESEHISDQASKCSEAIFGRSVVDRSSEINETAGSELECGYRTEHHVIKWSCLQHVLPNTSKFVLTIKSISICKAIIQTIRHII